jgi:hypothetical protein
MSREIIAPLTTTERLQSTAPTVDSGRIIIPVFWVYLNHDDKWRVRKEGGAAEAAFDSRDRATAFPRDLVDALPSKRQMAASSGMNRAMRGIRCLGRQLDPVTS